MGIKLVIVICLVFMVTLSSGVGVHLMWPSPPPSNTTVDIAIIITPGAEIDGLQYQVLGQTIQDRFSGGRMWIALLYDFPLNTPNPLSLGSGVDDAISKLKGAGFKGDNIFLAGHSLGGVFVGIYGQQNPSKLKGVLLLASYLTRGHKLRDYPLPVLTLSGDLDGLTRITRIVDTFEELENETINNPSPVNLMYSKPVIVIRGIDHGIFASGVMPSNVKNHDIKADDDRLDGNNGKQTIAFNILNFVVATLGEPVQYKDAVLKNLKQAFLDTKAIIQPLSMIKALDTNGGQHSSTTIKAQELLVGTDLAAHMQVDDSEVSGTAISFYEPKVNSNRSFAHVQTYTAVVTPFDPEDVSLNPQTPSELQSVMKSKAAMAALFPDVTPASDDKSCRDANKMAFDIAFNASSKIVRERAIKRNSPNITLHDDVALSSLPEWATYSLNLEYGSNGELDVTSYSVIMKSHQFFSSMSGTYHCKLLSPYRAMEWLYIDSLKRST